ncbi:2-phosphosulfolactate phosphatase [Candidatus Bipolaricaulota bacterium]|nr:2-phosphosulfolactate phosphatase [Candidatus Bipolaricaulota bacterium]
MKIKKLSLLEGAKEAEGLAVVIDVFRAFSTSCYLSANGVERILPVEEVREAKKLAEENSGFILVGERGGKKLPGFQFGNSPSSIEGRDFSGKTAVLTTSAGTKGLKAAGGSEEMITGSLVNLGAVVSYIRSREPRTVSLVPMGKDGKKPTEEDELCADWIEAKLEGKDLKNVNSKIESLKKGDGRRFFKEENQNWSPKRDFYLCTDVNRFDFVVKAYPFGKEDLVLRDVSV